MGLIVRVFSIDLAGNADHGQRAVWKNVFCELRSDEGTVGEGGGLMSKADEQQSDGASHAHQPLSCVRLSHCHLVLTLSRFRCLYGGFH